MGEQTGEGQSHAMCMCMRMRMTKPKRGTNSSDASQLEEGFMQLYGGWHCGKI